jgi:PAS domain-containing protein
MEEVAKGRNLDTYLQVTTKDEIGHLTESYNQMIQNLKESQKSLRETEGKYHRIFEDSKDRVYITSADGKLLDVNQAGVDLFGYGSKEEMMQVHVRDTFFIPRTKRDL